MMISWTDIYHVVSATVPLYVSMILAYVSVKHLKLFTPDQCSGINKFVTKFSIPLLSFQVISANNPYTMNPRLVLSDFLQKIFAVLTLAVVTKFLSPRGRSGGFDCIISGLSISTLPNTLILGIPILRAMCGGESINILVQIVVLQSLIWYNLLIFLFELNAAREGSNAVPVEHTGTQTLEAGEEREVKEEEEEEARTLRTKGETRKILLTVWKKLISNPNTYATLAGLIWASVHFRWGFKMPEMVDKSIQLLSSGGLGMAMFSLGLFMASQSSIIACGKRMAAIAMAMKFIFGPALMAASSLAIGLRGNLLRVAILQAALPQGIVPFVFAREYNVHPEILSTGVIFGMLIALPISLAYYFLLAL